MTVLARKISRAKWEASSTLNNFEIAADAVTSDLRTQGNKLFFWACATSDERALQEVMLAFAAGIDTIDKLDIAWIDADDVTQNGISLSRTLGNTPIASLRERHMDVEKLDMIRLGKVAVLVAAAVNGDSYFRWTKAAVRKAIADAVRNSLVPLDALQPKVKTEIERELRSASE